MYSLSLQYFIKHTVSKNAKICNTKSRLLHTKGAPSGNEKSNGYWSNIANQRNFLNELSAKLNITSTDDWYKVTTKDFYEHGGASLLRNHYNDSPSTLLSTLLSEHNWLPWKFDRCPTNYWDDLSNQKKFINWASHQLNIKDMSDWYKITTKSINDIGGSSLLRHKYKGSLSLMLTTLYPEYEWMLWKFTKAPWNMWGDKKLVRKFLDYVGKELDVKELSDWYKVSVTDIIKYGGSTLLYKYNHSLPKALALAYPEFNSEMPDKSKFHKKSQQILKSMLKTIFPTEEVLEDYKHPDLSSSSGYPLELDFFYPKINLAFEYQGKQHYRNIKMFNNKLEDSQQRDLQKSIQCKEKGITLIEIPYWWDRKFESLIATIYSQRPELIKDKPLGEAIPEAPPKPIQQNDSLSKTSLMTATIWEESMNPTGWWMSEKYDGVRLYWNGSQFLTRQGKVVKVPKEISSKMPQVSMEGELWYMLHRYLNIYYIRTQYGLYQDAVQLCRNKEDSSKWGKAKFWVFDAPGMVSQPYEKRIEYLNQLEEKGTLPPFVQIVDSVKCEGPEHLKQFFDSIVAKRGEGVMLREPNSLYKLGRSGSLRKFKHFYDTEVKVIENNYPHGFNCQQIDGKLLFVGLVDNFQEAKNIKTGSVISVKHLGTNIYGTLQFPKFYRERRDFKWPS